MKGRMVLQALLVLLPWGLRRRLLQAFFKYEIHPTARIGLSIIAPDKLVMGEKTKIGHLTYAKGLAEIRMAPFSQLGHLNWVTGYPLSGKRFFTKFPDRYPALILAEHSAIHHRNMIDCSDTVSIGPFSRVAGWWHQFLSHSIDFATANQSCAPITVGRYCFVGTGVILLKGSSVPDFSVVGAGSVVTKKHETEAMLYSGVPAVAVRELNRDLPFFTRTTGVSDLPVTTNVQASS